MKISVMEILMAVVVLTVTVFTIGCSKKEPEPPVPTISFDELENQRGIANANSKANASRWRGENGYEKTSLYARGDSTQSNTCPQGDGWASMDLLDPDSKQAVVKLKCSTVSFNLGCYEESDFKKKPYAAQENNCDRSLPARLTKLEQ